jgi:hypothetical protein
MQMYTFGQLFGDPLEVFGYDEFRSQRCTHNAWFGGGRLCA